MPNPFDKLPDSYLNPSKEDRMKAKFTYGGNKIQAVSRSPSSGHDSAVSILTPQQTQQAASDNAKAINLIRAEANKIAEEWEKLPQELQDSWLANSAFVAAGFSALDNLLPWPVLGAVITYLNPQMAAMINASVAKFPDAADKGAIAGTIIGLVGGPLAFAKLGKGAIKAIQSNAVRVAGYNGARTVKQVREELVRNARKFLSENKGQKAVNFAKKAAKDIKTIEAFERKWSSMIRKSNWSREQIRRRLTELVTDLPDSHPLIRATNGKRDFYYSFWDNVPTPDNPPTNWLRDAWDAAKFKFKDLDDNIVVEASKMLAYVGGDAFATWQYSYNDWIDKGHSKEEASKLAWAYMLDVTKWDVAGDLAASKSPAGKKFIALVLRFGFLAPDLGGDGTVRRDVYPEVETPNAFDNAFGNRGGQNFGDTGRFNTGGNVRKPTRRGIFRRR